MVLAAKIFRVTEDASLEDIGAKLKGFKLEENYAEDNFEYKLITEIPSVNLRSHVLRGTFVEDKVFHVYHHGQTLPVARTVEADFTFSRHENMLLLTVLEKKTEANRIANFLSEALFITSGRIVEARITSETLQRYHEDNPAGTKVMFFDDVDIPNISKLSLYGPDLANTELYRDYLKHGKIWYAVVSSKKFNYVVGLTRNAIVTVFTRVDPPDFLSYISDEIFPLLDHRV